MYIIKNNEAIQVYSPTFKDLGLGEVQHLQEWIRTKPNMLGERLLIINKEFSGWDKTSERLDLLALDEDGNLVVIENKLDNSGKDVTWQALKYASYCSTLTHDQIVQIFQDYLNKLGTSKDAEDELRDFFEEEVYSGIRLNNEQRIILVAADFRIEVTSTVLWLLERNVDIKCIKVTPSKHGENIFIDVEQIIPIKEAEEYQVKLGVKKLQDKIAQNNAVVNEENRGFDFSKSDIPQGAELKFVFDETKKCKVVEGRQVEYEGEIYPSLDILSKKLLEEIGKKTSKVAGIWNFTFEDTSLLCHRKPNRAKIDKLKKLGWLEVVESIHDPKIRQALLSCPPDTKENIDALRKTLTPKIIHPDKRIALLELLDEMS